MTAARLPTAALLVALALGLAACGSSSSEGTSGATAGERGAAATGAEQSRPAPAGGKKRKPAAQGGQRASAEEATHFEPAGHEDSAGGVGRFEREGGDNSIQELGSEASGSDFDEAAATLHAFLDARAARAWGAACERLLPAISRQLVQQLGGQGGGSDCASTLASLTGGVPDSSLRRAALADVGAFRVEGDRGFLLFEGADGRDYFMPMAREDGRWKVAAIAASLLL